MVAENHGTVQGPKPAGTRCDGTHNPIGKPPSLVIARTDGQTPLLANWGPGPDDFQTAGNLPDTIPGGMTMFESATDIIITQDRDTVVLFADAVAARKAGTEVDQLAAGLGDDTIVSDDMTDLIACISEFDMTDLPLAA